MKEKLDWDPLLDDNRVVVKADDGRVILSGAVNTFDEIDHAVGDAWAVGGVKAVDSELMVGLVGDAIADLDIAAASAAALDADRFVPKGAVRADVQEGFVTLTGQVRRRFQRKAAEHAVGRVAGVRGVADQITLTDEPIPSDVAGRITGRSNATLAALDEQEGGAAGGIGFAIPSDTVMPISRQLIASGRVTNSGQAAPPSRAPTPWTAREIP